MRQVSSVYAFNRGLCSPLALARTDQKRIALSAETMTNWMVRVIGSMSLRPGLGYIGATYNNAAAKYIPFVFATNDTALVEFTNQIMRVWINDVLLTRSAVSTAVTNGTFAGDITGWTDGSDSGGSIAWDAGNYMRLTGNGTARAIAYQELTVIAADQNVEHALRVVIQRGPVTFYVGTSLGDDSLVSRTVLDTGSHSIAFTPTGGTFVQFSSTAAYKVQISQCTIESAGVVALTSPYLASGLSNIRYDQSGDVIFIACSGYQQRKVERRGTSPNARSWSLPVYQSDNGPFQVQNITPTTLTASATTGDITLTASTSLFRTTHVGCLFKMVNQVAGVNASIAAQNTFTSSLKVTGSGLQRSITITLTGTWAAVVTLQVSPDDSTWTDVPGLVWNGNVTGPYLDGLDGQTRYYRVGIKTGDYTSGTLGASLTYTGGTLTGIVRITAYTSATSVEAQVLSDVGSTSATAQWAEGSWSTKRGYPTAIRLHEGRLWWAGQNGIYASVSDDYYNHSPDVIGDSGPINRTIGAGPVDTINWLIGLQRMVVGAQGMELSIRSSALDTPLTPTDFVLKTCSTQGSAAIDPVKMNLDGFYVDRTGVKVYKLSFDLRNWMYPDYSSSDMTVIVPELALPGLTRMAIQSKPDTRLHCIRSDGTVMVLVYDAQEEVSAWLDLETDGLIEDAVVLPGANGSTDDQVYYVINRTINGSTVRYLEKWAKETECRGGTLNKQGDSFITFTQSSSTTVSGLSHLIGESVVVWQDGVDAQDTDGDIKEFTVSASGTITLDTAATTGIVGLPYTSQWQSMKLGLQPSLAQSILTENKRINKLGVIAKWFHAKGLQFGADFDHLDDMPQIEQGTTVTGTSVRTSYDDKMVFPTVWSTDSRLCLQARAPRPVTLLAAVIDMEIYS